MSKLLHILAATALACTLMAQSGGLYDPDKVQELRLYFEQADWEAQLDALKQAGDKARMSARAVLNGRSYEGVGVRFKGNSSYNNARNVYGRKLPLNIEADYTVAGQKFEGGYDKLKLANVFRDPSFVREALSYEIARQYMHAPQANFIHVYVNDKYYGLYSNVESIDEEFVERHFGVPQADALLAKCDPEWEDVEKKNHCQGAKPYATLEYLGNDSLCYHDIYEMKSERGWAELVRLTRRLKHQPEQVAELLDVDAALWMLAFNNVLVNLDSYTGMLAHNYYLAQDAHGRWQPLIWDLNLSFGAFRYAEEGKALSNQEMQELSLFVHYKNPARPLISALLAERRQRLTYIAHVRTILQEHFAEGQYKKALAAWQKRIDAAVQKDEQKFYTYQAFLNNANQTEKAGKEAIIGIAELMDARAKALLAHPLLQKPAPQIGQVSAKKTGSQWQISVPVSGAKLVEVAYRKVGSGSFSSLPMSAANGTYSAQLPADAPLEYYIVAEAEDALSLAPARAAFEFFSLK